MVIVLIKDLPSPKAHAMTYSSTTGMSFGYFTE